MSNERQDFVLGVHSDLAGLRKFIQEMESTPSSLKRIADRIKAVDLGDGRKFEGDGDKLARALIAGFRAELTGGNFSRAVHQAMRDLKFEIPAGAKAKFSKDIAQLAAELRKLPQNVRVGVGVGKDLSRLPLEHDRAKSRDARKAEMASLAKTKAEEAAALSAAKAKEKADEKAGKAAEAAALAKEKAEQKSAAAYDRAWTAAHAEEARRNRKAAEAQAAEAQRRERSQQREAQRAVRAKEAEQRAAERAAAKEAAPGQRAQELAARRTEKENHDARIRAIKREERENERRARQLEREQAQERKILGQRQALASGLTGGMADVEAIDRAKRESRQFAADKQKLFERKVPTQEGRDRVNALVEADQIRKRLSTAKRSEFLESGSFLGKVRAGLTGFGGMGMTELATRITASSAIYNTASAGISLVQQAVSELAQGTLAFEEALGNLNVTMGDGTGSLRGFATEVGAIANQVGVTQAQGVEAASRSVGLFGTGDQSLVDKQDFARTVVEVSGRIARQAGIKDLTQVETPLAGTIRGFGLGNADITRVEDAVAVISKASGASAKDLIDASAQVALLAKNAGFTLEQTNAIIANQATATGETAQSASELLAQVFAQAVNPTVIAKLQGAGINTTGTTLQEQVAQVAEKRRQGQLSDRALASLQAPFGRSRAGGAFAQLITQQERIQALAERAASSPGEGKKQFEDATKTITFELTKMVGALRNLATEVAQSGALDFLAAAVVAVKLTAEALTQVLTLFNGMPRILRSAAFGLLEVAAVMKLLRGGSILSQFKTAAVFGARVGGVGAQGALRGVMGLGESAAGRHVAVSGGRHVAESAGRGPLASAALNPLAVAAAAAVAALVIAKNVGDSASAASRAEVRASKIGGGAVTVEDLKNAASLRREAALAQEKRQGVVFGLGGVVNNAFGGGTIEAAKRANEKQSADLEAQAKALEEAQRKAAQAGGGFGRFTSADEINTQLQALTESGYSAAQRVELLSKAFDRVRESATSAAAATLIQGEQVDFGQKLGGAVTRAIAEGLGQAGLLTEASPLTNPGFAKTLLGEGGLLNVLPGQSALANKFLAPGVDIKAAKAAATAQQRLAGADTSGLQTDASKLVQDILASRGKDASKGDVALTPEDIAAVNKALDEFGKQRFEKLLGDIDGLPASVKSVFIASLKTNIAGVFKGFKPEGLDATQVNLALTPIFDAANEAFAEGSKTDRGKASQARVKTMRKQIEDQRKLIQKQLEGIDPRLASAIATDPNSDYSKSMTMLSKFERMLGDAITEDSKIQLETAVALGKLRTSRRGVLDEQGRAGDNIAELRANLKAAVDPIDKINAQVALNDALAAEVSKGLDRKTSSQRARIDPRDATGLAAAARQDAQRRLAFARKNGDQKAIDDATTALGEARLAEAQALVSVAAAKRLAAAPQGDAVAAAKAALVNAEAEKKATKKGTEDYYNALVRVAEARKATTDALLGRRKIKDLLSIDLTDPVAQANAEVRAAQAALANAKGPDARDQAQLDLRNAQSNAEGAAFQQRLSDAQTANELGRMSHEAYLSYLNSEHDRLSAIKVRSRLQTDELNEVDKLLKSAADELNGQFNIGNIKLPTIYEVRRAIAAGSGGIGGIAAYNQQSRVTTNVSNLTINGVAPQDIYDYIDLALGIGGH